MKILLIFPRIEHGTTTFIDKKSWIPVLLGYPIITMPHIAALTPKKHIVEIVNENFENIDFNTDADLIGITTYTMTAPRVYEIADEFRRRRKKVVLGGYHVTALPNEALNHADSIVLGMAEASWPELLTDLENGKLKPIYPYNSNYNMANIPPLRRDLIKRNPFMGAIQSTRGCNNRCEFCAIGNFCNHEFRQRPIKNVVKEIKQMPHKMFIFHDPHLTINPNYARKLFQEMIKNKIKKKWIANGTTNVLSKIDDEFLNLARKSGCVEWFVGFESINQDALNKSKKTHNRIEDFNKLIRKVHNHGMTVQGGIIFGFDEDTPNIFDATLKELNDIDMDILEINILTPYPGTPLFERFKNEGRITSYDWSRYNQVDVVFQPKHMTEKELFEGAKRVAKEFYSGRKIIKRTFEIFSIVKRPSAVIVAGSNFTFRRYYKREYCF
jgi:radical SAM superfamily enzyme YgiQ (UPF0313 family)